MKDDTLYEISTLIINSILCNEFDCTEAERVSKSGINVIEELYMYSMSFYLDSDDLPSIYSAILVGDYNVSNNKFYPLTVVTNDINNKNKYCEISTRNLVISMVSMDNKYNPSNKLGLFSGVDNKDKLLQYEFMRCDRNYIRIRLNSSNRDNIIVKGISEGISCDKDKFDKIYKYNRVLISEDIRDGCFIAEFLSSNKREVIFKDTDIHKFYKFLESEVLKILLKEEKETKLLKQEAKKQAKKDRKDRIDHIVNELLEDGTYNLEEETLEIQTEELLKASDLLFEQYEYNYAIVEEMNKVLAGESSMLNVAKIVSDGMENKLKSIDFLAQKTYLYKPRQYMSFVFDNLKNEDVYEGIDEDIKAYVKPKFLKELDSYQYNNIQPQIIKQSKIFVKEIDELNLIIDEIQELYELIKLNKMGKDDALKQIEIKKEKINKANGLKLRSTYKKLHEFALFLGFEKSRQKSTSHLIYKKDSVSVPIPNKRGDIKPGLLSAIVKQLGSSRESFCRFNI